LDGTCPGQCPGHVQDIEIFLGHCPVPALPGGGRKPVYSPKLTHLKITHYPSLSNKKIKGIVHTFPNIIHLDFEGSTDCTGKVLKLIAESYPNLKYLNISALPGSIGSENNIGLFAIA